MYDVITIPYQCEDLVYEVTLKFLRVYFTTYMGVHFMSFQGFKFRFFTTVRLRPLFGFVHYLRS